MYEELGKEKRDNWFMICIDPIIDTVYTTKSKNQHIFSYVLPSLLNIKTNLLSKTLLKEYQDVKEGKEGYDQSIFKLSHYFMDQIRKRDDEETSVLFLLNILRVDKQSGLIGKEPGDYLGNQPYQLPIALAEKYGQCGNDEIRLALFDLICSSLYVWIAMISLDIDNIAFVWTWMGFDSTAPSELLSKWESSLPSWSLRFIHSFMFSYYHGSQCCYEEV